MWIVVAKYLVPKGYSAITVFPFVFLSNKDDVGNQVLIVHESIHIRQQLEMLVLPFFLWYFAEYLIRLAKLRNHNSAYRGISFEREAYSNEYNPMFLNQRVFWNFIKYI
ncbi:MAG: hypothetical protein PSV16_14390 [Flavobacterium sp.]|nr:hypothetical protein [Flavobacterium sp.]